MRNRFRTICVVLSILGSLFIVLGVFLLIPIFISILYAETINPFLFPCILSILVGLILRKLFHAGNPNMLQAMLICSLGWIGVSAIGCIPYVLGIDASYLNAFFEAISGFTTTGITMFSGLDQMPRGILFWRSMTQWIGGLGILTFFLFITYRGGSAHRLFGAESHKITVERPVPGLFNTLRILWVIYTGFTLFVCCSLLIAGVPLFDSICHSFTVLSTGGFSTHDASIEYFRLTGHTNFVWIEYIFIIGMLMGGTNFLIHYRILHGDRKALFDTTEMKYWISFILVFLVIILLERFAKVDYLNQKTFYDLTFLKHLEENFRTVLFQVVAVITTTGYATRDIGGPLFGSMAKQLFLIMMLIGGCVGSTGGGFKVLRVGILIQLIRREIFRLRTPSKAVSSVTIDGNPIEANEVYRVSALLFAWIGLLIIGGAVTALLSKFDAYQSLSGMFSALGNIGPCYIPWQEMGQLNPLIKLMYIFGMLAGRLEILPVLILFSPRAWR